MEVQSLIDNINRNNDTDIQNSDTRPNTTNAYSSEKSSSSSSSSSFSSYKQIQTTTNRKHPIILVLLGVNAFFLLVIIGFEVTRAISLQYTNTTTTTTTKYSINHDNHDNDIVVYGYIHMAKTAGTTINGELSMHYERICGNKGYSYDAYQNNERLRIGSNNGTIPISTRYYTGDIYSKTYKLHNRGRIPEQMIIEIGYEDCDFISIEQPWGKWMKIRDTISIPHNLHLELHLPCRDPLDHLMSSCNFKHKKFNCNDDHPDVNAGSSSSGNLTSSRLDMLKEQIKDCDLFLNRFSKRLINEHNMNVKCYNSFPTSRYIQYMDTKLQKKKIQTDYIHRDSNEERNKDMECIWNDEYLANEVRNILITDYEYYQFCNECIGSDMDLFK